MRELGLNKPIRGERWGSTVGVKGRYLESTGSNRRKRKQDIKQERKHAEEEKYGEEEQKGRKKATKSTTEEIE